MWHLPSRRPPRFRFKVSTCCCTSVCCSVSAGTHPPSNSSSAFSVIQTPPFLNVSEGSDVTLNCRVEGNVSARSWFVNWLKMGRKIKNSTRVFPLTNDTARSSALTLKSVVIDDSAIYHCQTGDADGSRMGSTTLTIWEPPSVAVNQTPQHVNKSEGANVTITCSFKNVGDLSLLEVTWHKDNQELRNLKHSKKLKQKAFIKLVNVNVEDSGNYVCLIRIRNRTGSGNGTHVKIAAGRRKTTQKANTNSGEGRQPGPSQENTGSALGIPVGVGVAVGTLIFFLLLGAMMWRSRRNTKGASENPPQAEPAVTEEARKHASLTREASDVTYAHIRFHKTEAQPDGEVVYAEVRTGAKRPEHKDGGTQPAGLR